MSQTQITMPGTRHASLCPACYPPHAPHSFLEAPTRPTNPPRWKHRVSSPVSGCWYRSGLGSRFLRSDSIHSRSHRARCSGGREATSSCSGANTAALRRGVEVQESMKRCAGQGRQAGRPLARAAAETLQGRVIAGCCKYSVFKYSAGSGECGEGHTLMQGRWGQGSVQPQAAQCAGPVHRPA